MLGVGDTAGSTSAKSLAFLSTFLMQLYVKQKMKLWNTSIKILRTERYLRSHLVSSSCFADRLLTVTWQM